MAMGREHGDVHWNEAMVSDVDAAKRFYEETVGWRFKPMPMDGGYTYHLAMKGDAVICGLCDVAMLGDAGIPPHWMTYLAVDDIDAVCAKTPELGGLVTRPPFDVPGVGRIAMIRDAGGAVIGMMTPAPQD